MRVLVTVSAGLIGSGLVACFDERASSVIGIDNAFDRVEQLTGRAMRSEYVDQHREGDHICDISRRDLSRRSSTHGMPD
jgi:nucleoside-diphosphate-sugar epimerase